MALMEKIRKIEYMNRSAVLKALSAACLPSAYATSVWAHVGAAPSGVPTRRLAVANPLRLSRVHRQGLAPLVASLPLALVHE